MNYFTTTSMFNTGFLSPELVDETRVAQGLLPQTFGNDCAYTYKGTTTGLAGNPVVMYPAGVTPLPTYGMPPIPTNCPRRGYPPCTQWVQPP